MGKNKKSQSKFMLLKIVGFQEDLVSRASFQIAFFPFKAFR